MIIRPSFSSEDEAARVYIACGKACLNWGPIELALEGFLIFLRNVSAQDQDVFPREFGRKVAEIKRLIRLHPRFSVIADEIRPLMGRAKELHVVRTDIVHSRCDGTNYQGEIMFGKSAHKEGKAYVPRRHLISAVEAAAEEMPDVADGLSVALQSLRALR